MATEHSQVTTDHDEIRRWAEERGGHPASVQGTEHGSEHAGILRIRFPGSSSDEALEDIDWDTFFSKFEEYMSIRVNRPPVSSPDSRTV